MDCHFLLQGIILTQGPLQITKLFNILLILKYVGTSYLQECQQLTLTLWVCSVALVMSDSVRPYRQQPTRLLCPWDSPGKNTGVGCHFLLRCMKVKSESEVAESCPTLSNPMDSGPPGSSVHGISQARVLEWGAIAFSDVHPCKC